ncbi:N-acetylmuramoyl-L-alanine amidase [Agromyces laixinhei]|uniref:peptidoglycan recognition protein family protein n=1 Tax=Agromyces laixinhei TaxID=2585717 RepID=UPI0012EE812A|nr:N-acetylmuramoyl-L-alanine amidase [Agromyces laixinhei]
MSYNETPIAYPAAGANRPGRSRRPLGIVDHHMAGYLPGTSAMFMNPSTGYATNYGIGSMRSGVFEIHEYVPDDQVAWGNGNDFLNTYAVSIEHENNRAAGPASKPTPEVHELSARFHAALALKWDWRIDGRVQLVLRDFPNHDFYERSVTGFGTEFNVTGHRTVALKDCPRDLDMQWIVDRANTIINGGTAPQQLTIWQRQEKEIRMPYLMKCDDSEGRYGEIGKVYYILVEAATVTEVQSVAEANNLALRFGDAVSVTYATFEKRLGGKPTVTPV